MTRNDSDGIRDFYLLITGVDNGVYEVEYPNGSDGMTEGGLLRQARRRRPPAGQLDPVLHQFPDPYRLSGRRNGGAMPRHLSSLAPIPGAWELLYNIVHQ